MKDPTPVAKTVCALLSDWLPATTGTVDLRRRRRQHSIAVLQWNSTRSCCCPSADQKDPIRYGRSWRTSPAAETCPGTARRGRPALSSLRRSVADQRDQPALTTELQAELDLPIYFGNRNWQPYVEDAVADMREDGIERAAVFVTSAWSGYSGCTQYVEDIARARRAAGDGAPELVKLRPYFDHPLFVDMFAEAIAVAAGTLPAELGVTARLVFTAHSIPVAADERCGPRLYSRQVHYAASLVAAAAGYRDYDVVWQSRSGPAQIPWLGPDVGDHLTTLAEAGTSAVIVCPSVSWPTTSRWCGISTTNCGCRPKPPAWRSPGPAPPTPTGDSPDWLTG